MTKKKVYLVITGSILVDDDEPGAGDEQVDKLLDDVAALGINIDEAEVVD